MVFGDLIIDLTYIFIAIGCGLIGLITILFIILGDGIIGIVGIDLTTTTTDGIDHIDLGIIGIKDHLIIKAIMLFIMQVENSYRGKFNGRNSPKA